MTPPAPAAGQTYQWVQTTTLEGGHDHDIWEQEGSTGYDTEQTKGAELVPAVQFGFVKTQAIALPRRDTAPTGEIKGTVVAGLPYIGGQNGQVVARAGFAGAKIGGPIANPWVALSDLDAGDQQVYVGRGDADGTLRHQERPERHLPAVDLGRRPGLHPLELQRRRWPNGGDHQRRQQDRSSAGSPTCTATCSSTPTATASRTRASGRSRSSP